VRPLLIRRDAFDEVREIAWITPPPPPPLLEEKGRQRIGLIEPRRYRSGPFRLVASPGTDSGTDSGGLTRYREFP
jgi:hypothetical protein